VHARPSDLLLGVAWLAIVLVLGALGARRAAPET